MKTGKEKEFHEEQLIMIGLDLMGAGADVRLFLNNLETTPTFISLLSLESHVRTKPLFFT